MSLTSLPVLKDLTGCDNSPTPQQFHLANESVIAFTPEDLHADPNELGELTEDMLKAFAKLPDSAFDRSEREALFYTASRLHSCAAQWLEFIQGEDFSGTALKKDYLVGVTGHVSALAAGIRCALDPSLPRTRFFSKSYEAFDNELQYLKALPTFYSEELRACAQIQRACEELGKVPITSSPRFDTNQP